MGLLPDTLGCVLRMRRECRERFPCHRVQRKPPVSDPGMHHGTCVTHVPWCMSGSLTRSGVENVPSAYTTRNLAYLVKGPWWIQSQDNIRQFVTGSSCPFVFDVSHHCMCWVSINLTYQISWFCVLLCTPNYTTNARIKGYLWWFYLWQ